MNKLMRVVRNPMRIVPYIGSLGCLNWMPDSLYLKVMYRILTGGRLSLENPKRFNEKLQWLKLYDRNPDYTKVVDKYSVKEYVKERLGSRAVIPTLGVWDRFEEIDFKRLPDQFVLKTTHDSGSVVICEDRQKFNKKQAKRIMKRSLKRNYFYSGREWPYKNVRPRIIAEPYIVDESGFELKDYKIFTFSGVPWCIQVDYDRFTNHKRNFYTTEWDYIPFTTRYPTDPGRQIAKPENLSGMLDCARILAEGLGSPAFLRVDLYVVYNMIYFGELTFYHGSGYEKFTPESYDRKLGDFIRLNRMNRNKKKQFERIRYSEDMNL